MLTTEKSPFVITLDNSLPDQNSHEDRNTKIPDNFRINPNEIANLSLPVGNITSELNINLPPSISDAHNLLPYNYSNLDLAFSTPSTSLSFPTSIGDVVDSVKNVAFNIWVSLKDGFTRVSEFFETGRAESSTSVGTISSGNGDPGGKSYGPWQLASKTGTLGSYIKSSQFKDEFDRLKIASTSFDRKWREIAEREPEVFRNEQLSFILKTHFYPVIREAASLGFDLNNIAEQAMLYSASVQHSFRGVKRILQGALGGNNTEDRIERFYQSRSNYVSRLSLPSRTKASVLNRYDREEIMVKGLLNDNEAMA